MMAAAAGEMSWSIYWFMFPVSICVATLATLSGIGGAALFTPIFLIVFPLLGPEYPFPTVAAAIGVSLVTGTFGFLSGFTGYLRKGLIDFRSAWPFIWVGVPVAIVGGILLSALTGHGNELRGAYALLMFVLCAELLRRSAAPAQTGPIDDLSVRNGDARQITARNGTVYRYRAPRQGKGAVATGIGAFLTGLLGVGIGEVVMPQLVTRNHVPVAVAAPTSVFIAMVVLAAASFAQVSALVAGGGISAVPWNAVVYTVPGVLIGGQIGPWLQGRVDQRTMVRSIAALFLVIGVAMAWIAVRNVLFS